MITRSGSHRLTALALTAVIALAACGGSDSPATGDTLDTVAGEPVPAGCPPREGTDAATQTFDEAPPFCLDDGATYSATVSTTAGDITIDLDAANAPTTVNNFVFLARNNYFDDVVCHRVIRDFVAQCGDPTASGSGGPGYSFADELPAEGSYSIGSIAMANSGPNTNGSQFFVISGPNGAQLPPLYSLFGQVRPDDLDDVAEMNARGSLDGQGIATEEIRILDVTITQS